MKGDGMNQIPGQRLILVVDDIASERAVISHMIQNPSFKVEEVDSAEGCLEIMARQKPDVVLLDIIMPGMDGNDLLKEIRHKYSRLELPVIMISAREDSCEIVESLQIGANDYIAKPVHRDVVMMRINTQLALLDLSQKIANMRQIEAINSLIYTYSNVLNDPLTIAMGNLAKAGKRHFDDDNLAKAREALQRTADVVRKIADISQKDHVDFEDYMRSLKAFGSGV